MLGECEPGSKEVPKVDGGIHDWRLTMECGHRPLNCLGQDTSRVDHLHSNCEASFPWLVITNVCLSSSLLPKTHRYDIGIRLDKQLVSP